MPPPPPKEVCQEIAKTVCYPHVVVTQEQVPRQVCTQQCKDIVEEVSCLYKPVRLRVDTQPFMTSMMKDLPLTGSMIHKSTELTN